MANQGRITEGSWVKVSSPNDKWYGRTCEVINVLTGNVNPRTMTLEPVVELQPIDMQQGGENRELPIRCVEAV